MNAPKPPNTKIDLLIQMIRIGRIRHLQIQTDKKVRNDVELVQLEPKLYFAFLLLLPYKPKLEIDKIINTHISRQRSHLNLSEYNLDS